MARNPALVNGRRRRQTIRRTKHKYRKGALDARRASDQRELQLKMSTCIQSWRTMALFTAFFFTLCETHPATKGMYGNYALITRLFFMTYLHRSGLMEELDMALYDIPPEELAQQVYVKPIAYRTIDSLEDDRVARDLTRFTKQELRELYELFGIPDLVRMGSIRRSNTLFQICISTTIKAKTSLITN